MVINDISPYIMKGIKPKSGKWSDETEVADGVVDYLVEPSVEEVVKSLVPTLINIMVYHALIESKASEHSARMVAMKTASDNAKDLAEGLLLQFNKARQAHITKEIIEITSTMNALT